MQLLSFGQVSFFFVIIGTATTTKPTSSPVVTSSITPSPTDDTRSSTDLNPILFGTIGGIVMALIAFCITVACVLRRRRKPTVNFQVNQDTGVKGNDAYGIRLYSAISLAENEAYRPVKLEDIAENSDYVINQAMYDYPEAPAVTNIPTAVNEAYGFRGV